MRGYETYLKNAELILSKGDYFADRQTRKIMLEMLCLVLEQKLITHQILAELRKNDGIQFQTILTNATLFLLGKNYSNELVSSFFTTLDNLLVDLFNVLQSYEENTEELYKAYLTALSNYCALNKVVN